MLQEYSIFHKSIILLIPKVNAISFKIFWPTINCNELKFRFIEKFFCLYLYTKKNCRHYIFRLKQYNKPIKNFLQLKY